MLLSRHSRLTQQQHPPIQATTKAGDTPFDDRSIQKALFQPERRTGKRRTTMRAKYRALTMAIIAFGVLVTTFISTRNLDYHESTVQKTPGETLTGKISESTVKSDRINEELIHLENIPPFMKNYFEWHRQQLEQLKKDEIVSTHGDDYLGNYRFLILRCASSTKNGKDVEDRCGGLSDRLKAFPLFLWYAATSNRILFIRWGNNRPAPIETFLQPGDYWNWTVPDVLMKKIEKLDDDDDRFNRLYFEGETRPHKKMMENLWKDDVWMIEANDYSGGSSRYKAFLQAAMNQTEIVLRPRDALYENFYHDLFHASFRPSPGVQKSLDSWFYGREKSSSWLPIPLQRNDYVVAQYRASYPKEPWKRTQNQTILKETTIHAVECAKSRVDVSAVYVTSDTALAVEAAHDFYASKDSIHVWTYLDLQSATADGSTHPTITLAEDPPHLNFATPEDISTFYVVFVDLFLMSYAHCVVYGAGGFGRMGSLVSYRPYCGTPYSINSGKLQQCNPYDES